MPSRPRVTSQMVSHGAGGAITRCLFGPLSDGEMVRGVSVHLAAPGVCGIGVLAFKQRPADTDVSWQNGQGFTGSIVPGGLTLPGVLYPSGSSAPLSIPSALLSDLEGGWRYLGVRVESTGTVTGAASWDVEPMRFTPRMSSEGSGPRLKRKKKCRVWLPYCGADGVPAGYVGVPIGGRPGGPPTVVPGQSVTVPGISSPDPLAGLDLSAEFRGRLRDGRLRAVDAKRLVGVLGLKEGRAGNAVIRGGKTYWRYPDGREEMAWSSSGGFTGGWDASHTIDSAEAADDYTANQSWRRPSVNRRG